MFENRKPVPFFAKGPDPKRFYARDIKRWSITGGECKKDGVKVKVEINSGWGRRETLASVAVPFIGFLLFGSMCLAIRYFDPQNENVGWFLLCIVGICGLQIPFFAALTWFEVSYFKRLPAEVLTVYGNCEFSIDGEKARRTLTETTFLRYTIHYSLSGGQGGGGSNSELDLVVREGDKEIAVHQLIAFTDNWCWKPAKKMSELSGIPLKRISRQWNGERFPPPLPS